MSDGAGGSSTRAVPCVTIPSDDVTFRDHVDRLTERYPGGDPAAFETRLRRLFPRAVVRARGISSEPELWYVYREGAWRPTSDPWWATPLVPHVVLGPDGWVRDANPPALSLLGIDDAQAHHYSDFVAQGATEEASHLFDMVSRGHAFTATVLLRPVGGDLIACEARGERVPEGVGVWLRLAEEVDVGPQPDPVALPRLRTLPTGDPVFGGYASQQLAAMSDPSPDGLGRRLRRMFPHARVDVVGEGQWVADRDGGRGHPDGATWWANPNLPRLRFDDRGRILAANRAATELLGTDPVGHHWQEFVTAGSQDEVQPVIDLLHDAGDVVSRFRLPVADGRLVDIDTYTHGVGDGFETTLRVRGSD